MSFPPKKAAPIPPQGDTPIAGMVKGFVKQKKGGFPPKKPAPGKMRPGSDSDYC